MLCSLCYSYPTVSKTVSLLIPLKCSERQQEHKQAPEVQFRGLKPSRRGHLSNYCTNLSVQMD